MYDRLTETKDETLAERIRGKTVAAIATDIWSSGQMIVAFDDETYVCFGVRYTYGGEVMGIEPQRLNLELDGWPVDKLAGTGIMTEEEYAALQVEREEEEREERIAQLRTRLVATYRALKQMGVDIILPDVDNEPPARKRTWRAGVLNEDGSVDYVEDSAERG